MLKLLHAADLHLDSAFAALPFEKARQRRQESRELFSALVDFGNDHSADLLLLAGDLFDSDAVYSQTGELLCEALAQFRGTVVIAPGNHDCYSAKSAYSRLHWSENVHIFTADTMQRLSLPALDCTVYGSAFTAADCAAWQGFHAGDRGVKIGVLHGEVGSKSTPYRSILPAQIAASGLDYLALGHVHQYSGIQKAGDTVWAYPGCLEGHGFDETGDKGFLFGTVGEGSAALRFIPFARRRYEVLEVDVTDQAPLHAIKQALPPQTQRDVYRIVLRGETPQPLDMDVLHAVLSERFYDLSLRDKTRPARSLWDREGEDTLRGLFLRALHEKYDRADTEEQRRLIEQAVRFGVGAMEGREL